MAGGLKNNKTDWEKGVELPISALDNIVCLNIEMHWNTKLMCTNESLQGYIMFN